MSEDNRLNRRRLLRGMGLALSTYAAPGVLGLNMARASDGSGGGSAASQGSGPSGPETRKAPSQTRRRAPALPEIIFAHQSQIEAALTAAHYKVLQTKALRGRYIYRLSPPPQMPLAAALRDLATRFPTGLADRNSLYTPAAFTCETGQCLSHQKVDWPTQSAAPSVKIGMIDTGVNPEHPALAGRRLTLIQSDLGDRAAAGRKHGTAVAALLIGAPDSTTPGLLPQAELIAIEAFHRAAQGEAADAFSLIDAIDQLLVHGVGVINLSFAGPENAVLHATVIAAHRAGVAMVAAAGNGGPGAAAAFPAAWPEVVAVTAPDSQDRPYRQANRGPYIRFAAPGVNIWTAASLSGGRLQSGTSYAAPFVTAALARSLAARPDLPLAAHIAALASCARDMGEPGQDSIFGHGILSLKNQCLA